ncbi:MAG: aspartate 1-decarboxylase [Egibacteraceae bacterium]
MFRTLMKSKLHRATVTEANLHYVGSITIDEDLMDAADLVAHEQVHVNNVTNGARLETYVVPAPRGSGQLCLNGASARLVQPGDKVIVISYAAYDAAEVRDHLPAIVLCDEANRVARIIGPEPAGTTTADLLSNSRDGGGMNMGRTAVA